VSLKKLGNGKWQVRYRDEHRKQRARNFKNQERARDFLKQLDRGDVRQGAEMLFADFADLWMRDYCRIEKAAGSVITDESLIRIHLKPSLGRVKLCGLTRPRLEEFRRELRERQHPRTGKQLATKTVNIVLSLVKNMLGTAVAWELLGVNAAAALKLFKMPEQEFAYWPEDERDFFLRKAREKDEAFAELCLVAAHTGLRRGELAALERRQLDFERRMITVGSSHCFKSGERLERTKTGRIRHVPMREVVYRALLSRKLQAPTAKVFGPAVLLHSSRRLRRLARQVGATPLRFHDLRHTFASNLVREGLPLYTVQRLLGHTTATMTQRYAHLSPDDLRAALGVPVNQKGTEEALVLSVVNDFSK
jgi:integrase